MRGEAAHEERLRRVAVALSTLGAEGLRTSDCETLARTEERLEALEQRLHAWSRHDAERWGKLKARAEKARADLQANQLQQLAALEQMRQRAHDVVERGRREAVQMDKAAAAFERDMLKQIGGSEAKGGTRHVQLCAEEYHQRHKAVHLLAERLRDEAAQSERRHVTAVEALASEVMMEVEERATGFDQAFAEAQKREKEVFESLLQSVEVFLDSFRAALKQHQEQRLKSEDGVLQVLESITQRLRELNDA